MRPPDRPCPLHRLMDADMGMAVAFVARAAERARARQATSTGGATPHLTARLPEAVKVEAREEAARLVGVSPRYVSDAKAVR